MEKLLLGLVLLGGLVAGAQGCPFHCTCQNLSESLSTLCADKGLLFVPVNIDRRTVELRLADNFIRTVEQQDFLNMSGLVDLTLSRNTIGFIQPFSFGDLESLRSLHLDGNRLVALREDNLSGLVNLQHLIVNNNQLASIVASAFDHFQATLEDLDLSFNNLQRVPWGAIGGMGNLHTLNLDHNLIEHVAAGTFGELLKLARLDMTSNRLQTLPPDPLFARSQAGLAPPTPRPPPVSLNFGGNPLHCNCQLLWLRRLARDDDMETCATPAPLAGRYFWRVAEEEFVCEPPLITRHTHKVWVLEGQRATLKCRAIGDPEPEIHWVSPRDRMVANSSRVTSYGNGTLDILVATAGDDGAYTCFAANAAGESTARAELRIIPLPHRGDGNGNGNGSAPPRLPHAGPGPGPGRTPGSSDISTSTRPLVNGTEGRRERQGAVSVGDVTGTGALVRWTAPASRHAVWMYQIQYNSSVDDTLVYRIIPSSSRAFALRNLISGVEYDLCVLAIHGDAATQLAATAVVGCARFGTSEEYPHCHPLHARLLGGTLTVAAGGVVVVALLLFTVGAMVKYRLCGGSGNAGRLPKVTDVHSQTNGAAAVAAGVANTKMAPPPPPSSSASALHQRGKRFRSRARGKRGGAAEGSAPGRDRDRPRPRPPPPAPPRLLLLPKAKRSCSLDMGEAAACYGYTAKSFGAIWTKRSQSVHGTLVELANGGGSTDDDGYGLVDNRTTLCSSGEMEESIV